MTTIVLPVDFSEASANAVRYAAAMSCDRNLRRIILLYTACVSAYDSIAVEGDGGLITRERDKGQALLTEMSRQLVTECPAGTKIQTALNVMPVLRAVHRLIEDERADLVVVG
ncbi:MAG TPA: universal stress protein, partial [Puia sp.]|nr:universal stress protein [Puia sp.]